MLAIALSILFGFIAVSAASAIHASIGKGLRSHQRILTELSESAQVEASAGITEMRQRAVA